MSENTRPRGVVGYKMPEEICGPTDSYILVPKYPTPAFDSEGNSRPITEARMVHTEGVAYLVTPEKDWCWTDYSSTAPRFTLDDLLEACTLDNEVDLADWVRTFGHRLEANFGAVYHWAKSSS